MGQEPIHDTANIEKKHLKKIHSNMLTFLAIGIRDANLDKNK